MPVKGLSPCFRNCREPCILHLKPVTCSGAAYQFDAMRDQPSITLNARNGELIRAKKPPRTPSNENSRQCRLFASSSDLFRVAC